MPESPVPPARPHTRLRRTRRRLGPIGVGALIAAAGLVFGGLTTASGTTAHPASVPTRGDSIPNVTTVESTIKAYYGSASATYPNVGTVTIPSRTGNYAKEVAKIQDRAKTYLEGVLADPGSHGPNPAVVFDVDDTTLNTFDYEVYVNFAYTPASNQLFVENAAFPSVYGMPRLANWAAKAGFTVFFLTGRPEAQRAPTLQNLQNVGYGRAALRDARVYLKQPTPPAYLHCSASPNCTTIEYKSGTRAHIEALGYDLVADFGDQYSDLLGGHSGHKFKMPNPMYYLP